MDKWTYLGIPNYGLCWNLKDMMTIKKMVAKGKSWTEIGRVLGRTPSACVDRYRTIRIAELINSGGPDDTLITLTRRKKNV